MRRALPEVDGIEQSIDVEIARILEDNERQESACRAAIKATREADPTIHLGSLAEWQQRVSGTGISKTISVQKTSPSGEPIGWYRDGQSSGKPNRCMPTEQDVNAAFKKWTVALRRAVHPHVRAALLGKQSGRARQAVSLASKIIARVEQLSANGTPPHRRAKTIARQLKCSVDYVRRVLRDMAGQKSPKSLPKM